jgi:hypothetical protein
MGHFRGVEYLTGEPWLATTIKKLLESTVTTTSSLDSIRADLAKSMTASVVLLKPPTCRYRWPRLNRPMPWMRSVLTKTKYLATRDSNKPTKDFSLILPMMPIKANQTEPIGTVGPASDESEPSIEQLRSLFIKPDSTTIAADHEDLLRMMYDIHNRDPTSFTFRFPI